MLYRLKLSSIESEMVLELAVGAGVSRGQRRWQWVRELASGAENGKNCSGLRWAQELSGNAAVGSGRRSWQVEQNFGGWCKSRRLGQQMDIGTGRFAIQYFVWHSISIPKTGGLVVS